MELYGVNIEIIEKIADIVSSRELSEITIQDGEKSVTVKGKKCPPPPPVMPVSAPMAIPATPVQSAVAENKAVDVPAGNIVKSPIVGTFYAAPSPDKPAFVKVGDKVKKGDVVMIIESMKLMNEIQSDFDGVVEKILVSDGQAVEYDQPIMIIK